MKTIKDKNVLLTSVNHGLLTTANKHTNQFYNHEQLCCMCQAQALPQCLHVRGHVTTDRTGSWHILGFTEHPCVSRSLHVPDAENNVTEEKRVYYM